MTTTDFLPVLLVPTCIVAIPAAAMILQVEGWAWSGFDFVICWVVIAAAVAAYKLVSARTPNRLYRMAAAIAATTGVMLLWINGAVGLIGSENNPANLMYVGVLAVGLTGAAIARLRAAAMARALAVTAAAQLVVPAIALIFRRHDFSPGVAQVFGLNFFFVLMFATSALLFRTAGAAANRERNRRSLD